MSTVADAAAAPAGRGRALGRVYRGETRFDFVRKRRRWFLVSSLIILAGVVSLATRGLNYSIEFVGGTSWQVTSSTLTVAQAKSAITPLGLGGAEIEQLATNAHRTIVVEAKLGKGGAVPTAAQTDAVTNALATAAHVSSNAVDVEQVGPSWGGQITKKAIEALVAFFIIIAAYISIFFEWKMAAAAILAVLHDILVTVGIYSLTGFSVTPDTVVAFLTILGYSLYDTIVVFDRVRDNTAGLGATGKLTYTDVVNLSMNQTLARSINTSLVAILPILAVLVLGAEVLGAVTLQYFGLALFVGLTSGAYSSIFIASPLLAIFKEKESRYRSIREKLEARGSSLMLLTPAAVAAGALASDDKPRVRSRRTTAATGRGGRPGTSSRTSRVSGPTLAPSNGAAARAVEPEDVDLDEEELDLADEAPEEPAAPVKTTRPAAGGANNKASRPAPAKRSTNTAARPAPRPRKKNKRR